MEESMKAYEFWLSQFPESHHSLDDRRFYDFAEALAKTNEPVESNWLKSSLAEKTHKMRPEQVSNYDTRLNNIVAYLRDRNNRY